MISLEAKTETTASVLPIGSSLKEEEPSVSFSSLLKGLKLDKDDKVIQNGALVLSLKDEQEVSKSGLKSTNKDTLLSLLKSEDKALVETKEPVELNPKITQNMSVKEIKTLISNAKEYLKEKILSSDDYKLAQTKELPKTLKGLSELAQKLGIDVSKITIEEVRAQVPSKVSPVVNEVVIEKKATKEDATQAVKESTKEATTVTQPKADVKDVKTALAPKEIISSAKDEQIVKKSVASIVETKNEDTQRVEDKKIQEPKQLSIAKETPLFKAQTAKEHTTEQLVATKVFTPEEKTPKSRADETLKLLLRGEKPLQTNLNLTADFAVATAKVIAPSAVTETSKSLESLLHGEPKENSSSSKLDGLSTHKADSFEVKLNEAKQMIKYISSDVKSAIEDYKSPFTRVKVQLNPQKLGEVDLTIVSRGKNLHVTLSSNNAAINTLSANANELRAQLNNNGINNASLNFNNSSQNSEQNAGQQQQHRQNEQKADEEYGHFTQEEQNEEILNSLEIVVPNYA